jgi:hypothetical protein
MSNDKCERDGGECNEAIDTLRQEYHNMKANRNAFAHECDLVSHRNTLLKNCKSFKVQVKL